MRVSITLLLVLMAMLSGAQDLTQSYAHDLIIKNNNDSVRCKIIKQTEETIFFFSYQNNEEITNALKKSDVKKVIIDYYSKNDTTQKQTVKQSNVYTNKPQTVKKTTRAIKYERIPGFRFAGHFGPSYLLMNISEVNDPILKQYLRDLKSGRTYSFSFNYYGKKNLGVGAKYMNFNTKNRLDNVVMYTPNAPPQYGSIADNITMQYYGISLGYRLPTPKNNKWRAVFDWGYGYQSYVNNAIIIDPVTITTSTLAVSYEIGFDYSLSKNFAIGFTGLLVGSAATEYTYDFGSYKTTVKVPDNKQDNLGRAEFTIGLRYLIE